MICHDCIHWTCDKSTEASICLSMFLQLNHGTRNESHKSFLDEAHEQGLKVVPGMSDFPYTQMVPGPCIQTHYDCFNQSRDSYALNLQTGFLTEFQEYHPALSYFILINEPDLKMPSTTTTEPGGPKHMARAVVSAFDGLLEAEKLANVTGNLALELGRFGIWSYMERSRRETPLSRCFHLLTIQDSLYFDSTHVYNSLYTCEQCILCNIISDII